MLIASKEWVKIRNKAVDFRVDGMASGLPHREIK